MASTIPTSVIIKKKTKWKITPSQHRPVMLKKLEMETSSHL